ncbi:unnamed protein product [Camellia sinensis]
MTMDLLTISSPLSSNSLSSPPSLPYTSPSSKCSLASQQSPNNPKTQFGDSLGFELKQLNHSLHLWAPQTPATAMRGAASDAMGLLLKERIVLLGNQIDDFVADAIISQLLLLDAQDPSKDIRLFINSPGGSSIRLVGLSDATMAIYDVVKLVRADASTVALGISASTASIILGGGTKGKRLAMPNTRIMIHQPLGGASGQAIAVEIQAWEIMHNKDNVTKIISTCTGRPFEQVQKDIDRDHYMSPIEAVEYGIIDGVIDRDSIIPLIPCQKGCLSPGLASADCSSFFIPCPSRYWGFHCDWAGPEQNYSGVTVEMFYDSLVSIYEKRLFERF